MEVIPPKLDEDPNAANGVEKGGRVEAIGTKKVLPLPEEDVEGYLKETVLMHLRTGLEALLRAAHENGDLNRGTEKEKNEKPEKPETTRKTKIKKDMLHEASDDRVTGGPGGPFHPLLWLSDHLRQHAQEPGGKYRQMFDERMADIRAQKERELEQNSTT